MSVLWSDERHPNIPAWQLRRITLHEGIYVSHADGEVSAWLYGRGVKGR